MAYLGVNASTQFSFSKASTVNGQAFRPSAAGTKSSFRVDRGAGEKKTIPDSLDPVLRVVPLEKRRIRLNQTPCLPIPPRPGLQTTLMHDGASTWPSLSPSAAIFILIALLNIFEISPGVCGGSDKETLLAPNDDDLSAKGKAELEAAVKALRPRATFDATPVEFSIWDTHFRIPRNYLIVMNDWSGGPQTDVTLRVTLPGLKPLSEETRACLVDKSYGDVPGCVPFQFRNSSSGPSPDVVLSRIRGLSHNQEPFLHNKDPLAGKYALIITNGARMVRFTEWSRMAKYFNMTALFLPSKI